MPKLHLEIDMKSEADKIWNYLRDATISFPKTLPDFYNTIHVLEGDGISVGTVRQVHFAQGQPVSLVTEKIEIIDEENRMLSFSVTDGDILKYYNFFKADIFVFPKAEGEGSTVKYLFEFEKANEETPEPTLITDFIAKIFEKLDAFIVLGA